MLFTTADSIFIIANLNLLSKERKVAMIYDDWKKKRKIAIIYKYICVMKSHKEIFTIFGFSFGLLFASSTKKNIWKVVRAGYKSVWLEEGQEDQM